MESVSERIIQTISRSCRESGGLSKVLAEEKLDDLICLLGEAAALEANSLRVLAGERIALLKSPAFQPKLLKSGRELDRHLDELCSDSLKAYTEAKELNSNLNRAIQGQVTLVSSLSK